MLRGGHRTLKIIKKLPGAIVHSAARSGPGVRSTPKGERSIAIAQGAA